jgi:tetratricopeptide (TPR) repeat protein
MWNNLNLCILNKKQPMKQHFKHLTFAAISTLFASVSFGQKANETSAALEYIKFKDNMQMMMLGSGSIEDGQVTIKKAKEFIDLAAENESTKKSPKTLFYKGEIYTGYIMAFGADSILMKEHGEEYLNTGLESYKQSLAVSTKFKSDIEESINNKKALFGMGINQMYEKGMYKETGEAYELQVRFSDVLGQVDTTSIYNSAVCYDKAEAYDKAAANYLKLAKMNYKPTQNYLRASSSYRKNKQFTEAKALIEDARKINPLDKDLLLELVNMNIESGDAQGAENALAEAIATDPNNKQLHYTIGTIYIDLKKNDKAEAALNKALQIDPNYQDALYQLGAHLITWAGDVRATANQLKFGDKNYDKMVIESDDLYRRALTPLEKYIEISPNDKDVLTILSQLHRNLGDINKSAEYKKRADAIK